MDRLVVAAAVVLVAPLLWNLVGCWQAILNDARIISRDPALRSKLEILFAYPGFWALFWYRLSHALLHQNLPILSPLLPRLVMSVVRYFTAIDIHPAATISGGGIFIDHGTGLVVGAHAVIGAGATLYHGVTLGNSGKEVAPGAKRHPTIGERVVVGAGAKILGNIVIGDDVLVGANSVVTKHVPANHTAVGIPARILCHGAATGKDVAGAAICELHQRLIRVELQKKEAEVAAGQADSTAVQQQDLPSQKQQPTAGEARDPSPLALSSPDPSGKKAFGSSSSSSSSSSSFSSPSSSLVRVGPGALELSSPGRGQEQEQQRWRLGQQQQQQPLSLSPPSSSLEGGAVDQILYSERMLSAGA
eukprot:g10342.t1